MVGMYDLLVLLLLEMSHGRHEEQSPETRSPLGCPSQRGQGIRCSPAQTEEPWQMIARVWLDKPSAKVEPVIVERQRKAAR